MPVKTEKVNVFAYMVITLFVILGGLYFIVTSFFLVNSEVMLSIYFFLNLICAITLWMIALFIHKRSFNPLSIFIAFNVLFYVLMPSLAAMSGYRFIDSSAPEPYFSRLIAVNLIFLSLFSLGYIAAINRSLFAYNNYLIQFKHRTNNHKLLICCAAVGLLVGLFSTIYLQTNIGLPGSYEYGALTVMLSGQGWLLRMVELLPISGLLFILIGYHNKSKYLFVIGAFLLIAYVLFRMQFQNRENALKYVVMFFILKYAFFIKEKNWNIKIPSIYVGIALIIAVLPIFSGLRAGFGLEQLSEFYLYFLFRDLNFSEISAAILNDPAYNSMVPFVDTLGATFGMLVPRALWEDKPQAIAVLITSLITPVADYNPENPSFAYAPSYFSFFYVTGGYYLMYTVAVLGGYVLGRSANVVRESYLNNNPVTMLIGLIVVYYFAISGQKLDPANILTAMIIPIGYLLVISVLTKLAIKK